MNKYCIALGILLLSFSCSQNYNVDVIQDKKDVISQKNGGVNQQDKISGDETTTEEKKRIPTPKVCIQDTQEVKIYVYMYHYIRNRDWDKSDAGFINNAVVTENFEAQMKKFQELEKSGKIEILLLSELEKYQKANCFSNKNIVILTADDGWDDNYINLYPIAKKYNIKFNLSIISNYIQKIRYDNFMTLSELKEVSNNKYFEIIGHTYAHLDLRHLNDYYLNRELCQSKEILEKITNTTINTIIYPAGKYNSTTLIKSNKCGYSYGFTTQNGINTLKDLKNTPLKLKRLRVSRSTTVNELTHYFE